MTIARAALAALALWGLVLGCGEDTPLGEDLASPARREAVPAPAPGQASPPPPERNENDAGEPVPRTGAPAAIGEAPDRPVPADPGRATEEREERPSP